MNRIRLATQEEAESIKEHADLDSSCLVYALNTQNGTGLAVRRMCIEVDPMIVPEEWGTRDRALFTHDLEVTLAGQGAATYYFNVDATDEAWQKVIKTWGAEQVSPAPMIRFKRTL